MPRIRMLTTVQGSPDGVAAYWYREGREYPEPGTPCSPALAAVFCRDDFETATGRRGPAAVLIEEGRAIAPEAPANRVTDTAALCGHVSARGNVCGRRLPCPRHGG